MKLYIVRLGQVKSNALNIYNTEDEDLNEKGIEQANKLKYKIKEYEL